VLKAVLSCAVPLVSATVPSVVDVVVSVNTTEPVAAVGSTLAVSVTLALVVAVVAEVASDVVLEVRLLALLTVMESALDVLDAYVVDPP
jgi:hypothetical protein